MFEFLKKRVKKSEFNNHKTAVQTALNNIKQDMGSLSKWIEHLNNENSKVKEEIKDIYDDISDIKSEIENLGNMISLVGNPKVFKQRQTVFEKQTAVDGVQTAVQTAVQTEILDRLTISERALLMILINSDIKLSYEDLSAMLGKDSNTIRGQINNIKRKCEGLIYEKIEKNNKKRLYIPEEIRNDMLKSVKVRVRKSKKRQKEEENY